VIPFLLAIVFTFGVVVAYDGLTRSDGPAPRERRKWRRVDQAEAFLRQAGVEGVRVRDFFVACAAAGIFLGLVAQFVLGWPLVSLVAAELGSVVPLAYLTPRRERRRGQVQVALVDLAAQLRAAIQAGYSIQEGLSQLAYADRSVLGPELQRLALDMRLKGLSVALAAFRDRLADPLADQIVAALLLNDRLGGKQMGAVLSRLAEATRQELSVQQEAKARQGQAVLSARVVAVVPGVVLVGMRLLSPDFMAVYDQPLGQLVLVGCVGWVLLGYGTMRWLGRLPRDSRVLVR
jgi:tight adherence protein B